MKYFQILVLLVCFPWMIVAQNVGINNNNPQTELDVNGDINLTGMIQANSVAGEAGQMLTATNGGTLAWADPCKYQHTKGFQNPNIDTVFWTVPADVEEILIELWGGGGGGHAAGGGGSGEYVIGTMPVTPGEVLWLVVGDGGGPLDLHGHLTYVQKSANTSIWMLAYYGYKATATNTGKGGHGTGGSSAAAAICKWFHIDGQNGQTTILNYSERTAGEFVETFQYGNGGNAPMTQYTGGQGGARVRGVGGGVVWQNIVGRDGQEPGGGGGGSYVAAGFEGGSGAQGAIVIHY